MLLCGRQPDPLCHPTLRGQWFVICSSVSKSSQMEFNRKILNMLVERCHFCSNGHLQCSLIVFPCKTWGRDATLLPASFPEHSSAGCCADEPPSSQETPQPETRWSKTCRRWQGNNRVSYSSSQIKYLEQPALDKLSGCLQERAAMEAFCRWL